jgi:uncharacterized membrane protein
MNILFLGEVAGASAEYMLNGLEYLKYEFTHIDCNTKLPTISEKYSTIIISDYSSNMISKSQSKKIIKQVENGTRFIMIGGWTSFNGFGKSYYGHPLADILPVKLKKNDDRKNTAQGQIIYPDSKLQTNVKLNWSVPPVICGYNDAKPDKDSQVLVWKKSIKSDGKTIKLQESQPFVVSKKYGKGLTIACLTDLAPHWCGGLVDWGSKRVKLKNVEVGDMYIRFIEFLVKHT